MTSPLSNLTRRQTLAGFGASLSLTALPACTRTASATNGSAASLLGNVAWNLIQHMPGTATSLGIDTGEHAALRGELSDPSPAGQDRLVATLQADLDSVKAVDTSSLDAQTRTSLEVVQSAYSTALDGFALPYGDVAVGGWRNTPYVVIQNVGAYIDLPRFMDADHPVRNSADAEAYIARLTRIPQVLSGELDRIRSAREMGMVPPAFLLDKAITQMEQSIKDAKNGESYVKSLAERTKDIPGNWAEQARKIVSGPIAEALEAQLAELKKERETAGNEAGMWAQPQGEEWYDWALRASTTTTKSADELHETGLRQLEEIHAEMDPILHDLGYTSGSVGERMTELGKDPRFQFAKGDPGRQEIMDFIYERIDWIKAQMPRAFNTLVDPNLEVRRIPKAEELGAPTAYGGAGSKDGKIPGRMWINLRTTDLHRRYTLPTLVHHEAIPGHIWQGEYANKLPLIRSILAFNAYSEGWALYAEKLADELGAYTEHPAWRLGYLQDQAFRACRLVADTGIHAKRWPREKAIRLFVERNGDPAEEIVPEVERYCSWPGQACGYKVGQNEILHQRDIAQKAMGSSYDIKGFDDAVVKGGNVPLDVLAKNIQRYIDGQNGLI
ncbi:DUF885 domain-containing protein [Altericroceibacterium spongiae]|uniref:DUF885 domain-containing protein n=1 Tax=Altericroceibacterium spongiae TaxID=2320269 RepID=A0A420EMG3_9SPHN|nr:DUF885 domain-containing protein [Altericroceibacterium spongiae]RKF21922.1 DUF885 domain-containing protein [Altericroceibacterium spongiae]